MKSQHILKRNISTIILMLAIIQLSPFLIEAKSFEKYHSFHQASILADADIGRILRNYRSQKTIYPASLVKMMVTLIFRNLLQTPMWLKSLRLELVCEVNRV